MPVFAQTHFTAQPTVAQIETADVLLVDIRRPEEWLETGVLPGAVLLTYEHFETPDAFIAALGPHLKPDQPVALICRTGSRTSRAAPALAARLDVPVIDLGGGMFRLMADGYRGVRPIADQGCAIC
ncbi:MAG: rhodanese-like domain-containing protein [Rhodobacteraceae bacterium]|nr:MAG: rhodanese-like domain-containing protein [Paracoccaceae bacterium]